MLYLLEQIWVATVDMAPYLLFGFGIAGALSVMVPSSFVEEHLGKDKLSSVFKATLAGVPLPLCSCGVIPVAAGLRNRGASKGATTAFLISTPQTGVDSILVTYALMGPIFAVFRLGAAIVGGIAGGIIVTATSNSDTEEESDQNQPNEILHDPDMSLKDKFSKAISYGFGTLPQDIGGSLVIGIIVAGAIATFIPPNFFGSFGDNTFISMIAMLIFGIPMYVCATASVPVAAALIAKGVSPGAALVFLMTGPATNAAAISAINSMMGRKCTIAFLSSVAVTSLAAGYLLNVIAPDINSATMHTGHTMLPALTGEVSAVILILVVLAALYKKRSNHATGSKSCCSHSKTDAPKNEETLWLKVENMTCSHCVNLVEKTILSSTGVTFVDVSQSTAIAEIRGANLSTPDIIAHLEHVGHNSTKIEKNS